MDLLLTGRWFDAEEALRWGILKEITTPADLLLKAWDLARLLESGPPLVYAAIKEVVREAEALRFQDALNRITKRQMPTVDRLYSSEDQLEGAVPLPKSGTRSGKGAEAGGLHEAGVKAGAVRSLDRRRIWRGPPGIPLTW